MGLKLCTTKQQRPKRRKNIVEEGRTVLADQSLIAQFADIYIKEEEEKEGTVDLDFDLTCLHG